MPPEDLITREECSGKEKDFRLSLERVHGRVDLIEKTTASIDTSAKIMSVSVCKMEKVMFGDQSADGLMTKVSNLGQKVYETTLTEAATSVTISSLNGNTDIIYRLRMRVINGYSGADNFRIKFNNDSGANYGLEFLYGTDTSAGADVSTNDTFPRLMDGAALNDIGITDLLIYAKSGFVRTVLEQSARRISGTTVDLDGLCGGVWNNTVDELTSIILYASQSNGLGIGTYICLEKLILS